jgi:hypothetical protein
MPKLNPAVRLSRSSSFPPLTYAVFTRVRKIAKSDNQLRHVCASVRPRAVTRLSLV